MYRQLKWIVYRKNYLIPQRPFLSRPNTFISNTTDILATFKKQFPREITEDLINRVKDPSQHKAIVEEYYKLHFNKKKQEE